MLSGCRTHGLIYFHGPGSPGASAPDESMIGTVVAIISGLIQFAEPQLAFIEAMLAEYTAG